MEGKEPSRTARAAAAHRAAHQTLEGGAIFADPFACAILGEEPQAIAAKEAADPMRRPMRLFVAARSRFAEDALAAAVARGLRQAVQLGAGFDTFALRNPHVALGLRVFEVDHPSTQLWKRERLAEAGLAVPESLTFVPVDFERQSLADGLSAAGFRADRAAFFLWLGVVPYLTREVIDGILRFVASLPASEIVFDYSEPPENYPPERRAVHAAMSARVASLGEPWISHFEPAEMATRFFRSPPGHSVGGAGPHVIHARRL
jgi:methyltransferase (TIGR00027 family)